ncbi:MAG: glycosyltransferase [Treponema sp.]|uniref:glycosyltransferase family 2 protein n=1 Tax=Treponema sp. TaxID=166 RepID=UPI00298E6BA5|nr:glycosyltransferase [Treponema sp.]MCQ2600284.1 glycosyltransferase [Treponema sp.]
MPLLSIIIPVFNVEKYLKKCLDSILIQDFKDYECILIDDGSKDSSGIICDQYAQNDKRIKVIHKKNTGVSDSRNIGIKESSGTWITFIDADDWIDERTFELTIPELNDNVDILVWGYTYTDGKNIIKELIPENGAMDMSQDLKSQWQGPCSKYFRSSLIKDNNISFPVGIKIAEDMYFTFQLYKMTSRIKGLSVSLYNYYQNTTSATHTGSIEKIEQEISIINNIEHMINELPDKERWNNWLYVRKATAKNRCLVYLDKPNFKFWRKTFSEIDDRLFKDSDVKRKFVYLCIKMKIDFVARFLIKMHMKTK